MFKGFHNGLPGFKCTHKFQLGEYMYKEYQINLGRSLKNVWENVWIPKYYKKNQNYHCSVPSINLLKLHLEHYIQVLFQ